MIGTQIHGNLPQKHGVFAEFVDFKAQFVQQFLIVKQLTAGGGGQSDGDWRQQALGGDFLLVGLQFFEKDPLA